MSQRAREIARVDSCPIPYRELIMRITGPIVRSTTGTQQFLFRVFRSPILSCQRWAGEALANTGDIFFSYEWAYNDYLFSMPGDTDKLVEIASRLAWADACLHVACEIEWVAIFNVEPNKPVDAETPVSILHPFKSYDHIYPDAVPRKGVIDWLVFTGEPKYLSWKNPDWTSGAVDNSAWQGFKSYDLVDPDLQLQYYSACLDPFMAANVSRICETGRAQKRMMVQSISRGDCYVTQKGNWILNMEGTLAKTRFMMWDSALASLPYQHTGWSLNEDGSIERRRAVAQSNHTLAGVSDLAQKRRMFIRRKFSLQRVMSEYQNCVKHCMGRLRNNELIGHSLPVTIDFTITDGGPYTMTFTVVPYENLKYMVSSVVHFMNLVQIAQGQNGLMVSYPGVSEVEREEEYNRIVAELIGEDGQWNNVFVKDGGQNPAIVRAICHLCLSVYEKMYLFEYAVYQQMNTTFDWTQYDILVWAANLCQIYINFANQWEELQGDCHAIMGLLASWQLTFNYYEKPRGKDATDVMRTPLMNPSLQKGIAETKKLWPWVTRSPDLLGRFTDEIPIMAPYRIFHTEIWPTGAVQSFNDAFIEQSRVRLEQNLQDFANNERTRQAQRRARRQQEVAQMQADFTAQNTPNPNDPWDYRNFTNKNWWSGRMMQPLNFEFTLRALDTPDEVQVIQDAWGQGKSAAEFAQRHESSFVLANKLIVGVIRARGLVHWPNLARLVVREVIHGAVKEVKANGQSWIQDQLKDKALGNLRDYNDATQRYSPRQFWPVDIEPGPTLSNNPEVEFHSGQGEWSGGTSGGGGVSVQWDNPVDPSLISGSF